MTTETVPAYFIAPTLNLAADLGTMLLTAITASIKPFEDRIQELEHELKKLTDEQITLSATVFEFEDYVEKAIENALNSIEVEVSAEVKSTGRFR